MIEAHPDVSSLTPATGKITRALLSVFDKTGIVDLATALAARGVKSYLQVARHVFSAKPASMSSP